MNYSIVKFSSFIIMLTLIWMNYHFDVSQGSTVMMVIGMIACGVFIIYSRGQTLFYAKRRHQIPLDASAEYAEEVKRDVDWMEGRESNKDFRRIGLIFLVILGMLHLTGCAGKIMYVEYGLDRMAPEDKTRLSHVLSTAPVGRRVSWHNPASNSQYTIKVTDDYRTGGGQDAQGNPVQRRCRTYLIDDVFPYNAHPRNRGHRQIEEDACWDPHQGRWYAINGWGPRPFIQIGGPVYHNWRRD